MKVKSRWFLLLILLVPAFVYAVDAVTFNMGLVVPTPGVTTGPQYAQEINADLYLLDAHNHSPGKGAPVPTSGLDINNDLTFASFNATDLRATRFTSQSGPLVLTSDIGQLYEVNGDLYWNDASGTPVQITAGAALDASTLGGFTGLAGTSGEANYTAVAGGFSFYQSTSPLQLAQIFSGPITILGLNTGPQLAGVSLLAPALDAGAGYDLTFPTALPTTTRMLLVSDAGVESYGPAAGGLNGILQLSPTNGYTVGPAALASNALLEMDADGGVYLGPPAPSVMSLLTMAADGGVRTLALPAIPTMSSYVVMSDGGTLSTGFPSTSASVIQAYTTTNLTGGVQTIATLSVVSHGGNLLVGPTPTAVGSSVISVALNNIQCSGSASPGDCEVDIGYSIDSASESWSTRVGHSLLVNQIEVAQWPTVLMTSIPAGSHTVTISVQATLTASSTASAQAGGFFVKEIQ